MSQRSSRKEEHLALAQMFFNIKNNSFDQVHLLRPALPETVVDKQVIKTSWLGKKIDAPFFINAMTGGSEKSKSINKGLAHVASKANIAMALGSGSILAKEYDQLDTFYIAREANPEGILIANVNPLTPAKTAKKIVEDLHADALQIHVNVLQEIAMPEGDRDFRWLAKMRDIRQEVNVPIIVKEVGSGLDPHSISLLKKEGFKWFDVGGSGGTNFAQIENGRRRHKLNYLDDLGLPTALATLLARKETGNLIVSGGVRNALDVFKGLVLGGKYVGVAGYFLNCLTKNGEEGLLEEVESWKDQLASLMALYGQSDLNNINVKTYFDSELLNQYEQLKNS